MNAPLAGIRVIEFSRGAAGAYCGMLLADMGADVILVDDPVDDFDTAVEAALGTPTQAGLRRNKRSVALDLATPEGRSLAHTLVRGAQVVIESHPPGAMAQAGLGYEALALAQPHLVYVSISAFGQDGPRAQTHSDTSALDALRGMLGATPGHLEAPRDMPVADLGAGLYAAFAVASALLAVQSSGKGVHIDVPMLGATLALASLRAGEAPVASFARPSQASAAVTGDLPAVTAAPVEFAAARPMLRANGPAAPLPTFRARDGYFGMDLDGNAYWRAICAIVHRVDLLDDPRYADARGRARHRALLREALEDVFVHDDRGVWLARLAAAGVPCAPISTYSRVLSDPQVAHMGWLRPMMLPSGETTHTFVSPVRMNGLGPVTHRDPPMPGEHTGDVLAELATPPLAADLSGETDTH